MPKQTPAEKAVAYLTEGKLSVQTHTATHARILAQGSDSRPYTITFDPSGWVCDCPAHVSECAHILAAKLISPLRQEQHTSLSSSSNPDLDKFLESFAATNGTTVDEINWSEFS
jgi:uncharacterized Zn finger protein